MKKTIITLILLLSLHVAGSAQWSVTPEAGMTAVNRASTENWDPSFKIGVSTEYAFNDFFSLQSGLHYTKRTYSFSTLYYFMDTEDLESWQIDVERNQGYLQLPVMMKIGWNVGEDVRLNLAAGPYLGYWIKSSGSASTWVNQPEYEYYYGYGYSSGYNYGYGLLSLIDGGRKWDWGATISLGLEVKNWVMNLGYDLSLGKEYKNDSVNANYHTISLSIGYKFKL